MTIFEKIIAGDIPSYKIAENDIFIAFLDVFPLKEGHTLVVPKKPVDYIFDLEDDLFTELHLFSKKIATAIAIAVPCVRIGTAVIGLEVPHTHIHLVPINNVGDINFSSPKIKVESSRMEELAESIKTAYNEL
ncbi:HIT family protein [Bacteroidia bacterium]|nr:HIT family protein [Bacteroidia bacterium]MDB9882773.1 HIT family protein [Bacteroidia bacterium]